MSQQASDDTRDTLPGNEPDLTDAERAVLAEALSDAPVPDDAGASGAATQEGEGDPPAEGAPAADDAPAADPAAAPPEPAADPAAAPALTAPPAAATTKQGGPVAFPSLSAGEARDFKADLAELKAKLEAGDIDDDAYTEGREEILIARTKYETQQELSTQLADQNWQVQVQAFLRQPENAALLRSPEIQDLWSAMMQRAVNNSAAAGTVLTDDWEIMAQGRDLLFETLGLSASVEPPAPVPAEPTTPPPIKPPPMDKVPPTLSGAPAATQTGAKVTGENLAAQPIEDLERIGHGLTEAQWEELLRGTPGSFVDD